jgi:hypothetical protein
MNENDDNLELTVRPRVSRTVALEIPEDTLESLKRIAATRDMSYQALMKFYIGQGLRQDVSHFFAEHVLEATAQVLARHFQSDEEVSAILQEIRGETIR